jgi:rhomboid protease GluP
MTHEPEETIPPEDEDWVPIPVDQIDPASGGLLTQRRARLWSLVLQARSLEHKVRPGAFGWKILVPPESLTASCQELRLYVAENRNWPPPLPPAHPMIENTLPTLSVLILLATFHNITGLDLNLMGRYPVDWLDIGNAHAGLILKGDWWRLVTALTLHADWLHLFSNLVIGGFFIVSLCRDLGSGLAWTLLLASGVLGNLANAYVQLPSHSSVGSSTAIFGAVGLLGAITLVRHRNNLRHRWPLPVAGALALLALLGTEGKNTDLGAHFFGFLFGLLLGLGSEWMMGRYGRPGPLLNALLAIGSAGVVIFSWWCALKFAL